MYILISIDFSLIKNSLFYFPCLLFSYGKDDDSVFKLKQYKTSSFPHPLLDARITNESIYSMNFIYNYLFNGRNFFFS